MTEAEWIVCADPGPMLTFVEGKVSDRKLRLFACACCRRVWNHIKVERCREAVEVAELFADDYLDSAELDACYRAADDAVPIFMDANWAAAYAAGSSAFDAARVSSYLTAEFVASRSAERAQSNARAAVSSGASEDQRKAAWDQFDVALDAGRSPARQAQAALLREIVGNPFQPAPTIGPGSSAVLELAEAVYAGEDCAFALHDALLESDHAELAGHFREGDHPKGCWGLDVILGRS